MSDVCRICKDFTVLFESEWRLYYSGVSLGCEHGLQYLMLLPYFCRPVLCICRLMSVNNENYVLTLFGLFLHLISFIPSNSLISLFLVPVARRKHPFRSLAYYAAMQSVHTTGDVFIVRQQEKKGKNILCSTRTHTYTDTHFIQ